MPKENSARRVQAVERETNADAVDDTNNNYAGRKDQSVGKDRPALWLTVNRWKRAISLSHDLNDTEHRILTHCLDQHVNRKTYQATGELEFWPGQATLANAIARHRETVGDALRHLEKGVGIIKRIHAGGKWRGSNRYRLLVSWLIETERQLAQDGLIKYWPDKRLPRPARKQLERLRLNPVADRVSAVAATGQGIGTPGVSAVPPLSYPSDDLPEDHKVEGKGEPSGEGSKKEKGNGTGQTFDDLAFKGLIRKIARSERLESDQAFALFVELYPEEDANRDKLRGAWINAVLKAKAPLVDVLAGALAWRLFRTRFKREFVPRPGRYLKWKGWERALPYRCDHADLVEIKRAILEEDSNALNEICQRMKSPFRMLWRTASWPDQERGYAREAFNALLASEKEYAPDRIIKRAQKLCDECAEDRRKPPLLAKWLKQVREDNESADNDLGRQVRRKVMETKEYAINDDGSVEWLK